MTGIPVHVPQRAQPKPWCYICGNPCIDAGDKGRRTLWPVLSGRRFVYRRVLACANCRDTEEE